MSNVFPSSVIADFKYTAAWAKSALYFMILLASASANLEAAYIERFSTVDNGGIAFTGNAVGLAKSAGENNPGKKDSIGAYHDNKS